MELADAGRIDTAPTGPNAAGRSAAIRAGRPTVAGAVMTVE